MQQKEAFDFWRREGFFHDPCWGWLHTSIKTQAASPKAFLFFGEMDYFMIPFGGGYILQTKPRRLRRMLFCSSESGIIS